jgi:hypothetical protein
LFRTRDLWVGQRTQMINALRVTGPHEVVRLEC